MSDWAISQCTDFSHVFLSTCKSTLKLWPSQLQVPSQTELLNSHVEALAVKFNYKKSNLTPVQLIDMGASFTDFARLFNRRKCWSPVVKLGRLHLRPFKLAECRTACHIAKACVSGDESMCACHEALVQCWPCKRQYGLTSAYQHSWKAFVRLVRQDFQEHLKVLHVLVQTNTTGVFTSTTRGG